MLRLIFTIYLVIATLAGPHVCCMTARAASLLPTVPISRPENHPCCPEEPKEEAIPPETPAVPCEAPTILFKIERHEASEYLTMPVLFVAEAPAATDLGLWTPNADFTHLYGTELLHAIQRLTC